MAYIEIPKEIVLKVENASVTNNTDFEVSPYSGNEGDWDPSTHAIFKDLIGKKAQSVQIKAGKNVYKLGGAEGSLDNVPFGLFGEIKVTFTPNPAMREVFEEQLNSDDSDLSDI